MILIKNTQRTIKLNTDLIEQDAQRVLQLIGYPDYDIGILFTTDNTIQKYNRTYRNKDKPTDILSFPFHPDIKPGERIAQEDMDSKNLGDLIISPTYVLNKAQELGTSFEERLRMILVHGICHLIGYTHETDRDYEIMQAKEDEILRHLKKL